LIFTEKRNSCLFWAITYAILAEGKPRIQKKIHIICRFERAFAEAQKYVYFVTPVIDDSIITNFEPLPRPSNLKFMVFLSKVTSPFLKG